MLKSLVRYFLYTLIFCSFSVASNAKVVAAISTLKGLVMVKPVGSRKYIPAYKGQMLKSGEWLKTKQGVFVAVVFLCNPFLVIVLSCYHLIVCCTLFLKLRSCCILR